MRMSAAVWALIIIWFLVSLMLAANGYLPIDTEMKGI